jgi:hypothetical protein
MQKQQPAKGVSLQGGYYEAKFYQIHCECGDNEHTFDVMAELTQDDYAIEFYISMKAISDRRSDYFAVMRDDNKVIQFFKDVANWFIRRSKLTWQVWTKGYVEVYSDVMMDEQHAMNFAGILEKAAKDLNDVKDKRKK